MDERVPARVVSRDGELAADEQTRLSRAVGRHVVEVHVAAILDREDDPFAVPERLADVRVRSAVPVDARGEDRVLAARDIDDRDLRVPREVLLLRQPAVRDACSVGRPRGRVAHAVGSCHPPRLAAFRRNHPDVRDQRDVPVVLPAGDERDLRAVR